MRVENPHNKVPYNQEGFIVSKNPNKIVKKSFYLSDKCIFSKTESVDTINHTYKVSETWCKKTNENMINEYSNITFDIDKCKRMSKIYNENLKMIQKVSPDYLMEFSF